MKRRFKWHKFKSMVKNFIILSLMVTALVFVICSLAHLLMAEMKAMLMFFISLALLVVFGVANKGVFS